MKKILSLLLIITTVPMFGQVFGTYSLANGNLNPPGNTPGALVSWPFTTPVIVGGLSASGSGANDFSGSTGTFLTSTGANTLGGACTDSDATTPQFVTAAGKTNTGFLGVNGKTSGAIKITCADAAARIVTLNLAAQTVGASTITIPDMAGNNATVYTTQNPPTSVSGNAGTATTLQTARTINGVSFNGSANITVNSYPTTLLSYTLSSDVGPVTGTANSWTNFISGQSFTVTNASAPIEVMFQSGIAQYDDSISVGSQLQGSISILIDGTTRYIIGTNNNYAALLNNDLNYIPTSSISIGTLSAATHTIAINYYSNVTLTTGASGFYCKPSANAPYQFLTFQVIQRN